MSELIEFLRARLADDEAAARASGVPGGDPNWWTSEAKGVPGGRFFSVRTRLVNRPVARVERLDGDDATALDAAATASHIARHDPARALREVEVKRKIIDRYVELHDRFAAAWSEYSDWLEGKPTPEPGTQTTQADPAIRDELLCTLRLLALPYATHPDYREEWGSA